MRIQGISGGSVNVGIGTINPQAPLHVNLSSNGTVLRLEDSDGICNHNPEAGSEIVSCSSDEKLKRDIKDAESVLDYFEKIRVRDYVVKKSGKGTTGVIAQEIRETHPEMVHEDVDGKLFVEQPNLWKLLKAIQEQQEQIDSLSSERSLFSSVSENNSGVLDQNIISKSIVDILYNGITKFKEITVKWHIKFGKDTVGQATILSGDREVIIEFNREYGTVPIITITPIGLHDFNYGIDEISSTEFKIVIDSSQSKDITFNWHAFASEENIIIKNKII